MNYNERIKSAIMEIKAVREHDEEMEKLQKHEWKPYCYTKSECDSPHIRILPTHGNCCTCQDCGQTHDKCMCQYFEEPCLSCKYKND